MKAALTTWKNRVAPVFDVAGQLRVIEAMQGRVVRQKSVALPAGALANKVVYLKRLGIDTLICGALSRPARELLYAGGLDVLAFVAGDVDEVVRAWLDGRLGQADFSMPGCRQARQRRCRRGHGWQPGCSRRRQRESQD